MIRGSSKYDILFWKCSSPCGVRFLAFDGVEGDPSSCIKLKLAWRSCPSRFGMNRSPYTRCLFLLGLAPGVLSLALPESSNSFSALLNALALIGSDPALSVPFILPRLPLTVGGVLESGGEASVGVLFSSMVRGLIRVCGGSIEASCIFNRVR